MSILNFGSLNIDHVYRVEHFPEAGETIASTDFQTFAGGKGLNQSVALAAAGAKVFHAGRIGTDGTLLRERLQKAGVDSRYIEIDSAEPTGHAVIMVDRRGRNCITIHGGTNRSITAGHISAVLGDFGAADWLLVQNEINAVPEIIRLAHDRGMTVVFNPAPMTGSVSGYPLSLVDLFIINETEGAGLTGNREPRAIMQAMTASYPHAATVLTLGEAGSLYGDHNRTLAVPAKKVEAVDTTAAGDTYIGFFLAEFMRHGDPEKAMALATAAAALCVTRHGAADSVPSRKEVEGGCV